MPVLQRGAQAEVGITGLFWIRLSSGPVFHSKSGPLCHPAHPRVMLSQQDILPPQHHPHPASTKRPFVPRKGTKLICFYAYQHTGSNSDLLTWWGVDHKCYLRWAADNLARGGWRYPFLTRQYILLKKSYLLFTPLAYLKATSRKKGEQHIDSLYSNKHHRNYLWGKSGKGSIPSIKKS